jgi:hypothetical protein
MQNFQSIFYIIDCPELLHFSDGGLQASVPESDQSGPPARAVKPTTTTVLIQKRRDWPGPA